MHGYWAGYSLKFHRGEYVLIIPRALIISWSTVTRRAKYNRRGGWGYRALSEVRRRQTDRQVPCPALRQVRLTVSCRDSCPKSSFYNPPLISLLDCRVVKALYGLQHPRVFKRLCVSFKVGPALEITAPRRRRGENSSFAGI